MAGHRRRTGRPLRSEARLDRRQAAAWKRLEHAKAPLDRLSAAHDYLRTALAVAPPAVRQSCCERLERMLTAEATTLIEAHKGGTS